jgi:uncharacterized membrane protein YjjP (DUF1212 family)
VSAPEFQSRLEAFEADVALVLDLGRALQSAGTPAHQFEDTLTEVSARLQLDAAFFGLPTAFIATLRREGFHRTHVVREGAGEPDIDRQDDLGALIHDLLEGRLGTEGVRFRLQQIRQRPRRYGRWMEVGSLAFTSAAAAGVLGGGWRELLLAAPMGFCVGLLGLMAHRRPTLGRILPALAAALISVLAALAAPYAATRILVLAGLIVFFPGLKLLMSLNELATGNLAAGSARLADVGITLVQLAFGTALGQQVVQNTLHLHAATHAIRPIPEAFHLLPLAGLAFGLMLLFQVRLKDFPLVLAGCFTAFFGARYGANTFGAQFGAALGAFAVTFGSNVLALWTKRTPALTLLPGLMVLVPGSLGYRGMASIFQNQVAAGLDTAFQMLFLAASLLFGILLANLVTPDLDRL